MNRTDRLYALVEDLRARAPRPMRAAELAARFEVSTRTIERDLLALQEAGVPIWAQPGTGGGYSLNPATTLPPLNLTPEEAVALATALAAMPAMPFAAAGKSALGKLADLTSIEYVFQVCAYLPLLGLLAAFLPGISERPGAWTLVGGAIILGGLVLGTVVRKPRPDILEE